MEGDNAARTSYVRIEDGLNLNNDDVSTELSSASSDNGTRSIVAALHAVCQNSCFSFLAPILESVDPTAAEINRLTPPRPRRRNDDDLLVRSPHAPGEAASSSYIPPDFIPRSWADIGKEESEEDPEEAARLAKEAKRKRPIRRTQTARDKFLDRIVDESLMKDLPLVIVQIVALFIQNTTIAATGKLGSGGLDVVPWSLYHEINKVLLEQNAGNARISTGFEMGQGFEEKFPK